MLVNFSLVENFKVAILSFFVCVCLCVPLQYWGANSGLVHDRLVVSH